MPHRSEQSIARAEKLRIFLLWSGLAVVVLIMLMMGLLFISKNHEQELQGKRAQSQVLGELVVSAFESEAMILDEHLAMLDSLHWHASTTNALSTELLAHSMPPKEGEAAPIAWLGTDGRVLGLSGAGALPIMERNEASKLLAELKAQADAQAVTVAIGEGEHRWFARALPVRSSKGVLTGALIGKLPTQWLQDLQRKAWLTQGLSLSLMVNGTEVLASQSAPIQGNHQERMRFSSAQKSLGLDARIEYDGSFIQHSWSHSLLILTLNLAMGIACLVVAAHLIHRMHKRLTQTILQEKLNQSQAQMQASFVANMTHELRSPVSGIVTACELLMHDKPSEHQLQTLDLIKKAGVHLIKLLNDILDLAKMDAKSIELKEDYVDMNELIHDCVELFRPLASSKSLELSWCVHEMGDLRVKLDALRLTQILTNILANAIKFTTHGHISVDVRLHRSELKSMASQLKISIEDTGVGIAQHELQRLFQPFFQASSPLARSLEGTGLGLTVSKELIDLMQGSISVNSEIGVGSTFTVIMPVMTRIEVASEQARAEPSVNATPANENSSPQVANHPLLGLRVLFAEDNPIIQSVYAALMKSLGCQCTIATNGQEAVELFELDQFDAVVMDCHMPKLDGFEATQRIRAYETRHERPRPTPIVALTASFAREDQLKCQEAGVTEFCTKPLNREALQAVLLKCCMA